MATGITEHLGLSSQCDGCGYDEPRDVVGIGQDCRMMYCIDCVQKMTEAHGCVMTDYFEYRMQDHRPPAKSVQECLAKTDVIMHQLSDRRPFTPDDYKNDPWAPKGFWTTENLFKHMDSFTFTCNDVLYTDEDQSEEPFEDDIATDPMLPECKSEPPKRTPTLPVPAPEKPFDWDAYSGFKPGKKY